MKKILIYADPSLYTLPKDNFANYVAAFEHCGAKVFISADESVISHCDALLLPGGADVHPSRYGEEMDQRCFVQPDRDAAEFAILDRFVKEGRPVLGICRGEQVINVYFGGSLHQHIDGHGMVGDPPKDSSHEVRVDDPLMESLFGKNFRVNSSHHQVVKKVGDGLIPMAWNGEGYVEGVRHESLKVYAVQWHPERMCLAHARPDTVDGSKLISAMLAMI